MLNPHMSKETEVYITNCNLNAKAQIFFVEQQFLGKMQEKVFAQMRSHPGGNTEEWIPACEPHAVLGLGQLI